MKFHGPLVTLAVGALAGGTLLAMSAQAARPQDQRRTAAPVASARASTPEAQAPAVTAGPSPEASLTPGPSAPEPAAAGEQTADEQTADKEPAGGGLAAYAGRLKGGRYALVMAVRGDRAVGYLCDGDRVEAWFRGSVSGAELRLTDPAGERLAATLRPGRATGQLDALGAHWSFSISAVEPASVKAVTAKVAP